MSGALDAQLHIYEPHREELPWEPGFLAMHESGRIATHATSRARVTAADTIGQIDAVGVAGGLLVASSHYGYDNSYVLDAATAHPDRFRVVGRLDPLAPDATDRVAAWKREPLGVGVRVIVMNDAEAAARASGAFDGLFGALERAGVTTCLMCVGRLEEAFAVARAFPQLRIVLDHVGLPQPPLITIGRDDPWAPLPDLLALADFENVAVKLTGIATLSAEAFPYRDLWPALHQLLDAYGPGRLLWGTDWTRSVGIVDYAQGYRFLADSDEIDDATKADVLGGALRRWFDWA